MNLEYVDCNNCGFSKFKILKAINPLKLVKCKRCGLIFFNPRFSKDIIKKVYEDDELGNTSYYSRTLKDDKVAFNNRLNKIENYIKKGKILDIGCSTGNFLLIAKKRGYKFLTGVEINKSSADYCKRLGFKVYNKLSEKKFKNQFDIVNLSDVIEHFDNPKKELFKIKNVLKKKGILIITTPNYNKWVTKLINIKPKEHLYYYTKKTLKCLLESVGYKILVLEETPRFHSIDTLLYSSTTNSFILRPLFKILLKTKLDKLFELLVIKNLKPDIFAVVAKE